MSKVCEELAELEHARKSNDGDAIEEEVGDVLFALVNVARFLKVDPEIALGKAVDKFMARFRYIEDKVDQSDRDLEDMTLEEMDICGKNRKGRIVIITALIVLNRVPNARGPNVRICTCRDPAIGCRPGFASPAQVSGQGLFKAFFILRSSFTVLHSPFPILYFHCTCIRESIFR